LKELELKASQWRLWAAVYGSFEFGIENCSVVNKEMMKVAKDTKGNVFEDLGFDASESADLALRAYLMSEIRKFIKTNELTQMRAARFFGVPQPKISYINNGKIEKISSDYLIGLLAKTGGDFRYSFRQPTKKQAAERLLV